MSETQVDWKGKYRGLAQELEKLEQTTDATEEQLRHLLGNMVLALEGENPQFDAELNTLKPLLHEPCAEHLGFLKKIGRRVEKQIKVRDDQRSKNAKQIVGALLKWIRILRDQVQNTGTQNLLDSLERRSTEVEERFYDLPAVMSDLIELQSHIEIIPTDTNDLNASEFSLDSDDAGVLSESDVELLLQRIGAELLELISSLHVPKQEGPNARSLIKQIEKGFGLSSLPEIVRDLVDLVIKSTSNASEDFEKYLLELSSRLTEVQTFVADSREEQQELGQNQRDLDQQVRQDVKKLHHTVKNTHDIGDLKKAVSLQLSGLVRAMDDFKKKEEEREQRVQGRYENLIQKVELMEQETQKVKAHMEEERLRARTDPLTGLPNRAAYDEHMLQEYERWSRYSTTFSVVVGDLDFFKKINDTYGHLAGDKVLRLVAKVITKNIRVTDFAARFGGEEFIIILPSTSASEAAQAMDKLRASLESSPFNFHGKPVGITMSFGVTEIKEGDSLDDIFTRADEALYQAKENGRNQVCSK
ncbi:GGDEF domain-containing protein [uncultured Neptuniibacter sp.]|uniref:GGDEF domain-containing protein n=1 Tax=uncultured Neptuniibacter sp. TaxID=502143 RepID=UPI002635D6F3|nr:GGDEF domain-containing protein [uncultured Neptuniibacter sp.]